MNQPSEVPSQCKSSGFHAEISVWERSESIPLGGGKRTLGPLGFVGRLGLSISLSFQEGNELQTCMRCECFRCFILSASAEDARLLLQCTASHAVWLFIWHLNVPSAGLDGSHFFHAYS